MLHEPDVTLTDYALACECLLFAWLIGRRKIWYTILFVALAIASLVGGTMHGFFPGSRVLWKATLLAMGVAALAIWRVGSSMQFSSKTTRRVARWLGLALAGYCAVALWVTDDYLLAIVVYLPAAAFLLIVLLAAFRRTRQRRALWGVAAVLLTFVAAILQQAGVALHRVYFDHNALYHVIQALALLLLYRTAAWSIEAFPETRP